MTLSKLNQQRFNKFKNNRRALVSSFLFLILLFLTLFCPFIANDKPLYVYHNGKSYFPLFTFYSEKDFGGTFETQANFKDPFVIDLIDKSGFMIMPPVPFSYDSINYNLQEPAPSRPNGDNWLGTDDQGRDVLARLLYGLRVSLVFGLALTAISYVLGVCAGALQGYFGGKVDLYFQRFMEIWGGLPVLFLLIILSSMFIPNIYWLLAIMSLFSWMNLVGVVRAEFFKSRSLDYVKAAQALGVPTLRIIWRHILPNAMIASITYIPFVLNMSITTLTSLDFLGFGLPPGSPSLGELLTQGKNNIQAPWLGLVGFFSLSFVLSLLIFIGEGIRDALDPKRK